MRSKASQNRFLRIVTIPIRVLGKARDLYVQSLTNCAQRVGGSGGAGCSSMGVYELPRSFSVSSSRSNESDDLRDLIRAASARSLAGRIEVEMYLQQQIKQAAALGAVPRSCSVGMASIDEEQPCCDFEEAKSTSNVKSKLLYPRSKSYAVTKRTVPFN